MNANNILAGEAIVAVGIVSWRDLRAGYAPIPGTVIKTGIAFGLISIVGYASPELASLLGAGFLLAQIVSYLQNPDQYKVVLPSGYQTQNYWLVGSKAPIAGTSADF